MMEKKNFVKALAVLAPPSCLRMFRGLEVDGADGLTPIALNDVVAIAIPVAHLSFHLDNSPTPALRGNGGKAATSPAGQHSTRCMALLPYLTDYGCQGKVCAAVSTLACDG